jgi:hypothetical protein
MGVLRIFRFLFDVIRLHRKLVHFGRRSNLFFAGRKAPQARSQTAYKSCESVSISAANVRVVEQCLINAVIVQVKSAQSHLSGNPTNQELALGCAIRTTGGRLSSARLSRTYTENALE